MKTDQLLRLMAADPALRINFDRRIALAFLAGMGFAAAVLLVMFGLRPDLVAALQSPVLAKTALPFAAGIVALGTARACARPGASLRGPVLALGVVISLVAGAYLIGVMVRGPGGIAAGLANPMMGMCLTAVLLLSTPILVLLIWAMRAGANLSPARNGAVAGLASGAAGAALYSVACDQDDVLFVVPAYSAAVLIVIVAGAIAGQFSLRL
jgi:hypothetical protein